MRKSTVRTIFGKRGSGKSCLAREIQASFDRVISIDPMGEYSNGVVFTDLNEMYNFLCQHGDKKFRVVYYPLDDREEVDQICHMACKLENCLLTLEEIDMYCQPNAIIDGFNYALRRGRHHNVDLLCISQRPFGINRVVTSQSDEIYTFLQTEPRDVQYLVNIFGNDAEGVQTLGEYEYLLFKNGTVSKLGGYKKSLAKIGNSDKINLQSVNNLTNDESVENMTNIKREEEN